MDVAPASNAARLAPLPGSYLWMTSTFPSTQGAADWIGLGSRLLRHPCQMDAIDLSATKGSRVKFQGLSEVGQKIVDAVVARIEMIFVWNTLSLKFLMQRHRTFVEAEVVFLAAVDVDSEFPEAGLVFPGQLKRTILFPVLHANRLAKDRTQQAA